MNAISQIKIRLVPYLRALPDIFNYQIATKILLALWLFLLGRVFQVLLRSTGRVAVTTGDWQFLFTTWQGIFILLLALISLFLYVAFDINSKIVLSRDLLTGKKFAFERCVKESFLSIGKMLNP